MNHIYRIISTAICSALLLAVFLLPASAQQKNSKKISLTVQNGTLEEILQSIIKQTSVRIVYNQELIRKSPRISFGASNEELKSVMKRLLNGSAFTFVLQDDVMIIAPREDPDDVKKKHIKGEVLDDKGMPLPVVTVNVTGTAATTYTTEQGKFSIELEEAGSLTYSYVGFQKKTVKPVSEEFQKIILIPEENKMNEVVITGYQEVSKRLSASSTFTLKGVDVKQPNVPNIASMLQGKVPGLSVVNTSGSPNAVPKLRIRGTSTLLGNANPIWVVDGVIRTNPDNANPDDLLGPDASTRDKILFKDGILSKSSLAGNSISGLNVNDVESITFLKDASATAIYGTSAANGVIVITTKKGIAGKLTIGYNAETNFNQRPSYNKLQLMDSKQRVQLSREIYEDGLFYENQPASVAYEGALMDLIGKRITQEQFAQRVARLETINTDWFNTLFQNSGSIAQHINFSGGTEKVKYYSSISYDNYKGSAKNDWQKRLSGMMSLNSEISSRLQINFSLDGSLRNSSGYYGIDPLGYALQTSRTIDPSISYPTLTIGADNIPLNYNVLNEIEQTGSSSRNLSLNATFGLNYRVLKGLRFRSLVNGAAQNLHSEEYATEYSNYVAKLRGYNYGSVTPGGALESLSTLPSGGVLQTDDKNNYNYSIRNTFEYDKRLFGDRDQLNIMAGQELSSVTYKGFSEFLLGYLKDRGESFAMLPQAYLFNQPRRVNTVQNSLSLFGSASYAIMGKYVLNANIRTDASNRFGQYANSRFLPIWSVAGRWNIGEEKWFQKSNMISGLDLKASYGFQGNVVSAVGPDLVAMMDENGGIDQFAKEYILKLKSLPYPDLRWEKTRSYNVEMHAALFNSFADFSVAYYDKRGTDVITQRKIPTEYGIASMYVNGGNIRNHGIEASVLLNLIRKENLSWTVSGTVSKNYNAVQQSSDAAQYNIFDYLSGTAQLTGQPVGTFYVFSFKGLNPKDGMPIFNKLDDASYVNGKPLTDYLVVGGKSNPDLTGGLHTSVRYKSFSVGMSFAFSLGATRLLNPIFQDLNGQTTPLASQNLNTAFAQRWRKPGDEKFTNIPSFVNYGGFQNLPDGASGINRYYAYSYSDVMLVSGDFLRCTALNLSYQFPDKLSKRCGFTSASIHTGVSNPFLFASKKLNGQDPEIAGIGGTALPITPAYNLGFNVSF
jgi:TonB-linked SusC/RagA family outer membrane protein